MARNKYAGRCKDCGDTVPAGEGYYERQPNRTWAVRHVLCTALGKIDKGWDYECLSLEQQKALDAYSVREVGDEAF